MKKQLIFLLTIFFGFSCYAQISFEKGYYINYSGQKTECLIRNVDWKNNPSYFEYKSLENGKIKTADIKSVKEFGIDDISKYMASTVQLDVSSENVNRLSYTKNPEFLEKELFLKSLVEGKGNLYLYENGNLKKFFYSKDDSNIEPLVYKSYKTSSNQVGKNILFKQQLLNSLKCSEIKLNQIENLEYKKKSLINLFIEYNKCSNSDFVSFGQKQSMGLFHLNVRPRLNNSSLVLQNSTTSSLYTDFENKLGFGLGIEAEYILPYNKNTWAIFVEPTYQSYKAEATSDGAFFSGGKLMAAVNYSSIEVPIGIRQYFFLNSKSRIFVNVAYIFALERSSSVIFKRVDNTTVFSPKINPRNNIAFGLGYKPNDRLGLEIRVQTNREILDNYVYWSSDFKTLSVIFGYSIF